jgi:hypothetical protein
MKDRQSRGGSLGAKTGTMNQTSDERKGKDEKIQQKIEYFGFRAE